MWIKNVSVLSFVILLCNGKLVRAQTDNEKNKNKNIESIIKKVYNISLASLVQANPNEKEETLHKIENKLKVSAKRFGSKADKYVHIVMHGLKALMSLDSRKQFEFQPLAQKQNKVKSDNNTKISHKASEKAVAQIAGKIFDILSKHTKNAKSMEEKIATIEQIRKKILQVAQEHSEINSNHNESKIYADLITRGMKQMLVKLAENKRTGLESGDKSNIKADKKNVPDIKEQYAKSVHLYAKIDELNTKTTMAYNLGFASTPFRSCESTVIETCKDIEDLVRYQCSGDILPLRKLCNGVIDCIDRSDEENCLDQAMERMGKSTQIMSRLESYITKKCFLSSDNTVLVRQKEILDEVLSKQRKFLEKYTGINSNEQLSNNKDIKVTTNEVAAVIETLAIALKSSLCMYEIPDRNKMDIRKDLTLLDEDVIELKMPLEKCNCNKSFCTNEVCSESCKLICWYKYTLVRWRCHAVDESTSVPLNSICDGKFDCNDESDEISCNTGARINKFEANEMYGKVLKLIENRSRSKEYAYVYGKMTLFYNDVKLLQKTTLKNNVDNLSIRNVRDKCFNSLLSIYEDVLRRATFVGDLDETHLFLQLVNEKLVTALKRSHVGNKKIVARDGCLCRQTQCIVENCPTNCQNACKVRQKLTQYWCKGTTTNMTVPIEFICNKIKDCPNEDDEAECQEEVCRKHHLLVLRETLKNIGKENKLTSIGETLKDWSAKIVNNLKDVEKKYRPTPTTFRDIVMDILNDLVITYASIDDKTAYRRNRNDTYFENFLKISQKIIWSVKKCNL
ncbi:hypothetical protein evm_000693 [Chilo suppressalis]|nr:hypothetical protein evm_000693 [Chilo suppressalis]